MRICALLVAVAWLLSGCGDGIVPPASPTLIPGEPTIGVPAGYVRISSRTASLYYPNAETLQLVRKNREIELEEDTELPEAVLDALLEPVDDAALMNILGGSATLLDMLASDGLLVVNLSFDAALTDKEIFSSLFAMTRTLAGETDAERILYLKEGKRIETKGIFVNPMPRESGALEELWPVQEIYLEKGWLPPEYRLSYALTEETCLALFLDETGSLLFAEETNIPTRRMTAAWLCRLLEANPAGDRRLAFSPAFDVTVNSLERINTPDGRTAAVVSLIAGKNTASDARKIPLLCGVITLSLCLNDQTLDCVGIRVNGVSAPALPGMESLSEEWIDTGNCLYLLGEYLTLYFRSNDGESLVRIRRAVSYADSVDPAAWLRELIAGPDEYDPEGLRPVFPQGFTAGDFLGVETDGTNAVLDFSSAFEALYPTRDAMEEKILIYSIVNTLTESDLIRRVLFRVEGHQPDTLGGGLYLGNPLMRNPGLIREEPNE